MDVLKPCRLLGTPFTGFSSQGRRQIVRLRAQHKDIGNSQQFTAGLAQLFLPGLAFAEDIVSDVQSSDVTNALPDALPAAEEVTDNRITLASSFVSMSY